MDLREYGQRDPAVGDLFEQSSVGEDHDASPIAVLDPRVAELRRVDEQVQQADPGTVEVHLGVLLADEEDARCEA